MTPEAARFARLAAALLLLAAHIARASRGAFPPGPASLALALAVSTAEAARNGFAVLGADESLTAEDRARLLGLAALFRRGAGVLATRMPGPRGGVSLPSLAGFSAPGLDGGGISDFFESALPRSAPVAVDGAAGAALDALRRDPLALAAEGAAGVSVLMGAAADGISVFGARAL